MMQRSSEHGTSKLWTIQGILASWGCVILFRAGYELCKSCLNQGQSEIQQSDGTNSSLCQSWDGQCNEVHLFRSWQGGKIGLEEELLDLHESGLDELAQQVEQNLSANETKVTAVVPEPSEKSSTTTGSMNVSFESSDNTHGLRGKVAAKASGRSNFWSRCACDDAE